MSDPPYGIVKTLHLVQLPYTYSESNLNNVLFTVEPTSVAFLDPAKYGGFLPMILSHRFWTVLNTGDVAYIEFTAALYTSSVTKI